MMMEHCCGDLLLFSHKSISEVGLMLGDYAWLAVATKLKGAAKHRFVRGMVKHDAHSRQCVYTAPDSNGDKHYTTPADV